MMDGEVVYKLITLPNTRLDKKLRSFTFGKNGSYLFDSEYNNVYEVVQYREYLRSWFAGEIVIQDGSLMMVTKVDPLFIVLSKLIADKQLFKSLQDIIGQENGAENVIKAVEANEKANLSTITQVKELDGEFYYRLDDKKLNLWLKAKVRQIVGCLKQLNIDVSSKSTKIKDFSSGRKHETNEKEYIVYSLSLLSKYLPEDLIKNLQQIYNVKIEIESDQPRVIQKGQKRSIDHVKHEKCEPTDNYYIEENKANGDSKKKVKLNKSQKELEENTNPSGDQLQQVKSINSIESNLQPVQVIIIHPSNYYWDKPDFIKNNIKTITGDSKSANHNIILNNPIDLSVIQETFKLVNTNIKVIITDAKYLITQLDNLEQEQLIRWASGYEGVWIQSIPEDGQSYLNNISITNEEVFMKLKKSNFIINQKIKLHNRTRWRLCGKCCHAFAGYHARCVNQPINQQN